MNTAETSRGQEVGTKRSAILAAAMRTFVKYGYSGTTMDLVARESGARRSTIYNNFASKKALFDAAVAHLWEELPLADSMKQAETAESPEDVLEAIGNVISDYWAPESAIIFLRMIIAESTRFPELAHIAEHRGAGRVRKTLITCLEGLASRGLLRLTDAEVAASQFVGMLVEPLLLLRLVDTRRAPGKRRRQVLVQETVQTFLARYSRLT